MRSRILGLCLLALAAPVSLAGKPPDLPDNPPVVVRPVPSLPPSAWLDAQSIFPAQPASVEYQLTLTPAGEQALQAALMLNVHPFLAFLPPEQLVAFADEGTCEPKPGACTYRPADTHVRFVDPAALPSVMDNLAVLEKAAEGVALAEKLVKQGKLVEAIAVLEEARQLVPGSGCAQRAEEVMKAVCGTDKPARGDAEEAEDDPLAQLIGGFHQFGMCQAGRVCDGCKSLAAAPLDLNTMLSRPVTVRFDNVPLGVVLANLHEVFPARVVVDGKVCMCQGVSVQAEQMPMIAVIDLIAKQACCKAHVCGDVVRVCGEGSTCKEVCCGSDGRCQGKCCQKACGSCCKLGCCYAASGTTSTKPDAVAKKCCCEAECCKRCKCNKGQECCCEKAAAKGGEASTCPKCEKMRAKEAKKLRKQAKAEKRAGVEEQVNGLMKGCYLAIEEERFDKAADLARQARALDPQRVEGDPVIYKFSLLGDRDGRETCPATAEQLGPPEGPAKAGVKKKKGKKQPKPAKADGGLSLRPNLPGVDPALVEAMDAVVVSNEAVGAKVRGARNTVVVRQVPLCPGQVLTNPCGKPTPAALPTCVKVTVTEARTGSMFMGAGQEPRVEAVKTVEWPTAGFGLYQVHTRVPLVAAALGSDAGLSGTVVLNERNFDAEGSVLTRLVGSSRVDLQACKLEYSIVSPK